MPRIQINSPERYIFNTVLDVRISDINYGRHLSSEVMLRMAHEARVRLFRGMQYEEDDVEGVGIILTAAAICYKGEVTYPANLQWRLAVEEISRTSVDIIYSVECIEMKKEVAMVNTTVTFFDYEKRRVSSIPRGFRTKVATMLE